MRRPGCRGPAGWLALALLGGCGPCNPPPPPNSCANDLSCPAQDICLLGTCQQLSTVLQNLTAVVTPPPGLSLAPQQYQPVDATQASLTLLLTPPQNWNITLPIPPTCTRDQALPMTLTFTGQSIVPLLDWSFSFITDASGNVHGALPAGQQFDEWIVPATPCAYPLSLTDDSASGFASIPAFQGGAAMLTVVGALSAAGTPGTLAGASVTLKGALDSVTGKPISGTVTSLGGPAGTLGFSLPVLTSQVLDPSGAGCAPPPVDASCDGGCPAVESCALFTLEIGPSASMLDGTWLPTVDLPIAARFVLDGGFIPLLPDGGTFVGPILSLMGEDGLGVRLPVGPAQLVNVSGTVLQPGGQPLTNAEVTVSCVQSDGGALCPQGYTYQLAGVSGQQDLEESLQPGAFILPVPPDGTYTITATPPLGLGLAPAITTVQVGSASVSGVTLTVPTGFLVSGTVADPSGTSVLGGGEVTATSLATGALAGNTTIAADGTFQLTLPPACTASSCAAPAAYLLVVQPDVSTGLPELSLPVTLAGEQKLGTISLLPGTLLTGGVFAAQSAPTQPSLPVPQATLQFFYVTANESFPFGVALPMASGITDQHGHFSVTVPSVAPTQ